MTWRQTGADWLPFSFWRKFVRFRVAATLVVAATAAFGAEYRDPAGAFAIAYDDAIWTISSGASGEFSIACRASGCGGIVTGCSGSRLWVPLASIGRLTREFDASATERAVMQGLAAEKTTVDGAKTSGGLGEVQPEVVKPYTLMHNRDGHPFHDSDYRVSLGGRVTRFLSFSTAARSHSIAMVCHVPEDALPAWRSRFDALIEGFRPSPDPFWLRFLARIGL